jgi:plastocyanin
MIRRLRILLTAAGLLGLTLITAPSVIAGDPCYHGYTIPPTTSAQASTVNLEPCAFVPTTAYVEAGDTVTFRNGSELAHLVLGSNASWGDRDVELAPGGTRTVRFDEPGVYAYSCALHRGMTGVIVVGDPDASDAAAVVSTSTGGPDWAGIVGLSALVLLGGLGWALAIIPRRNAT